jgi:hypothetical protein
VNVVVNRARPNGAAYAATLLDLAAGGHLRLTAPQPGQLACDWPPEPARTSGLLTSQRIVLAHALTSLAGVASAPFEVLAEACAADVRGCWDPFAKALQEEARSAGLTRRRVSAATRTVAQGGVIALGALIYLAVHAQSNTGSYAAVTIVFGGLVAVGLLSRLGRHDTLTAAGVARAAQWRRARADIPVADPVGVGFTGGAGSVTRLAYAVAAGVPEPSAGVWPGRASGIQDGRSRGYRGAWDQIGQPRAAWSSRTGQWRSVEIPKTPTASRAGRRSAQSPEVRFDGQVIARWVESDGDGGHDCCVAIDDGNRAWSFDAGPVMFDRMQLRDTVDVQVTGRSMRLLGLTRPGGPADAGWAEADAAAGTWLPAPGWLLTPGEIAEVLGRPVSGTAAPVPGGAAVIYRGSGVTVSVTVAEGALGGLSSRPARYFGRQMPGIGDEAWILNRDRTAVVRVGTLTAKITINDRGVAGQRVIDQPGVISELAATMAARLAEHAWRADDVVRTVRGADPPEDTDL